MIESLHSPDAVMNVCLHVPRSATDRTGKTLLVPDDEIAGMGKGKLMGFWSRFLAKPKAEVTSKSPTLERAAAREQATDSAPRKPSRTAGSSDYPLPPGSGQSVVGESHYQPALRAAARGGSAHMNGTNWGDAIKVVARLIPEPNNKFDRNAVAVEVDGKKVGYIPRERAGELQGVLIQLRGQGMVATCPGSIVGGGSRNYGIFLRHAEPEMITFFLNSPQHVYPAPGMNTVTVTGEESHQDVLSGLPGDCTRWHLATLHPSLVAKGKHAGAFTAEVRINDSAVGSLTGPMGQRFRPLMELAEQVGRVVGCIGFAQQNAVVVDPACQLMSRFARSIKGHQTAGRRSHRCGGL